MRKLRFVTCRLVKTKRQGSQTGRQFSKMTCFCAFIASFLKWLTFQWVAHQLTIWTGIQFLLNMWISWKLYDKVIISKKFHSVGDSLEEIEWYVLEEMKVELRISNTTLELMSNKNKSVYFWKIVAKMK